MFLVPNVDILEREVGEAILVGLPYVEKVLGVHADVTDSDVVTLRQWHVFTLSRFEELCPGTYYEEGAALACDVFHGDVLVVLGGVGSHLEPEHACCRLDVDASQDDITVVERLRAECKATVYLAIGTVLDDDVRVGTVGGIFVGPCTLSALEHDSIVVDMHVAAVNQHVLTDVEVDGIAAGCATLGGYRCDILGRGVDEASEVSDILAAVEVIGPEG